MGNSNSRSHPHHSYHHHPPAAWTQSFPRDYKRPPKISAAKVLPPPPHATNLRSTENGRSLHVAGTISGRRGQAPEPMPGPQSLTELASPCRAHPNGPPSYLSTSMTHLHHPCALHNPSPMMHTSPHRFGPPPTKVYTSEPDLRNSNMGSSLPPPTGSPHTIITQSPTKGRIKSKKRNKAPAPPSGAFSDGGERAVHWGATDTASSRPASQASRKKGGGGLFKKRNESRRSDAESSFIDDSHSGRTLYQKPENSSMMPREVHERRARARSVDCLQHELRTRRPSAERSDGVRRSGDGSSDEGEHEIRRAYPTIERERRSTRGVVDRKPSATHGDRRDPKSSYEISEDNRFRFMNAHPKSYVEKRSETESLNKVFYEWEIAEKELIKRKKRSEEMKNELQAAAKNLRKTDNSEILVRDVLSKSADIEDKQEPKPFFFGMKPDESEGDRIRIDGSRVEYKNKENSSVLSNQKSLRENNQPTDVPDDVENFIVAMEMQKREYKMNRSEILTNSVVRREDGGYHSRQNSGSFRLENSNFEVTANLRPVLPKRQREIPRFSPNAAWKFLGEEPFTSRENLNESRSSEDIVYEDKIRGYARPIAPPRGSGEKSADSGISGDAGSPGPMPDFEQIKPNRHSDILDTSNSHWRAIINGAPLASSSPVVSGDAKRAWTPAQDLDDNSMDGSAEIAQIPSNAPSEPAKLPARASMFDIFPQSQKDSLSRKRPAPPKLTSRTNMFPAASNDSSMTSVNSYSSKPIKEYNETSTPHSMGEIRHNEESTQTVETNLRKLKRSISNGFNNLNPNQNLMNGEGKHRNDKWRDNWSMSRSIPHSLNDESEVGSMKLSTAFGGGAIPPSYKRLQSEGNSCYPLQNGHIMYLPEYNSQLSSPGMVKTTSKVNVNGPAQGDMVVNITSRELNSSKHLNRDEIVMAPAAPQWKGKKGKKFSYQSTVRVLEKKKIEEQLDREVQQEENRRREEVAAMKQVEKEFQMKREREKSRLNQQLKLHQDEESSIGDSIIRDLSKNWSEESPKKAREAIANGDRVRLGVPAGIVEVKGRQEEESSYFHSGERRRSDSPVSIIHSDASSSMNSMRRTSRRPPDGAPSPRIEAVVSARHSNGMLATQELTELQQPRREYREYRRNDRPTKDSQGVGDNYRRDFSRGQTQALYDDKVVRIVTSDHPDGPSPPSTGPRLVRGKNTNFYEHPPATGNMAPVNGHYKMEMFRQHIAATQS